MKLKRYRVQPRQDVKLSDWDTSDDGGLKRDAAEAETQSLLARLADWQERLYAENRQSLLIVLQARDAGGKDGTVKHVFSGVNPQGVHVTSFKVPTSLEAAHDFLWRVHPHAPATGQIAIFNRSHYEDVLVTRVHGLIDDQEAKVRLEQIRDFEALLASRGTRIVKFYLHISREEQLERLRARLDQSDKRWKFNAEDLKERARWDDYTRVYQEAIAATSTADAPWYVIPADHKWFRNHLISRVLEDTLADMKPDYPSSDIDIKALKKQLKK